MLLYLSSPTAEVTQLIYNKGVYLSLKIPTDLHKYDVNTDCTESIIAWQAVNNDEVARKTMFSLDLL